MGILEFILATGKLGAILAVVILFGVYAFAEPAKEISFFGLKFHKRRIRFDKLKKFWPLPRRLPAEWRAVLQAFSYMDTNHLHRTRVYEYTSTFEDMSEIQSRQACDQLKRRALLREIGDYYRATDRAIKLIAKIQSEQA